MKIIADSNIPFVSECFSSIGEVQTAPGRQMSPEMLKDAQVLLVRSVTKVGPGLLEASDVKFAATATIGVDHIDQQWLEQKNIGFASAPGSNANSVAEYITAAMLKIAGKQGKKLSDCSIGIIGVGNVGSRVEKKAISLDMKVVLNDPPLARKTADPKYRPLEEALGCDFVTIHTPLTRDGQDPTYHMADREFFSKIKPGAVFMNTARGAVMETAAVENAVKEAKISGLVLDVWENEPDISMEMLKLADIATPHIAGYSFDGKVAGMIMIYDACCRHFGIEPSRKTADFLPRASVPFIDAAELTGDEQSRIEAAVSRVYDIMNDDSELRKITEQDAGQRPVYFDMLRKNYPVRREFTNTKVKGANKGLARKLSGIGFQVE
ncbi:Erythronate-4-phosphate dehydrogenase [Limihaloglobus sulfuriphilus]|uniref:Erythronate-4-phosphate dehydrogenase n=1 Tax=Limihaloglobus sulfuriphilus TaxID=1851148 RepID=A0A1Q2MBU5_9BACT|nr:4-phosphoerythronate dehydrogenase [Limihaloglobus sulfuriphilus]AQQ70144.1 Erythronate-4-phosphate dehydrogenase [Limihaloglobus sulfuriphilus]